MSKPKSEEPKAVRTTISLNPLVDQWAEELRKDGGFNSLSDLLSDLIRRRKEENEKGRPKREPAGPLPPGVKLPKERKPRKGPPGAQN